MPTSRPALRGLLIHILRMLNTKTKYRPVIASAHDQLSKEVQEFAKATAKVYEKCGKPMVHRVKKTGKDGKGGYDFWGCTGWPECDGKS